MRACHTRRLMDLSSNQQQLKGNFVALAVSMEQITKNSKIAFDGT